MNSFIRLNEAICYGVNKDCVHFHISLEDVHNLASKTMSPEEFRTANDPVKFIKAFPEIKRLFGQAINYVENDEFLNEYPDINKIYLISPLVSKHKVARMLEGYGFTVRDYSQLYDGEKMLARSIFKGDHEEVSVATKDL